MAKTKAAAAKVTKKAPKAKVASAKSVTATKGKRTKGKRTKGVPSKSTKVTTEGNLTVVETEPAQVLTLGGKTKAEKQPRKEKDSGEKVSCVAAAHKVLGEASEPLSTKQMIEAMAAKGYWTSPGGKTPHATLYSAILRDIVTKGSEARFKKAERGRLTVNA